MVARQRNPGSLRLAQALDLLRLPDHRLVLMHTPSGVAYYVVVPGGLAIIARPDIHAFDDVLFPGCPQSWRLGGAVAP